MLEILLITPFTNSKEEREFSRMSQIKTDFWNLLGRTRVDTHLQVSENGVEIPDFNPDPAIEICTSTWKHQTSIWNPENVKNKSSKVLDVDIIIISNL